MRSFGQLLLYFFVNFQIFLQIRYFFQKLLILKDQLFWLFGLELKLASQLMVLENSQSSSCIQLFFFERKQVRPHILYFGKHLVSKAIYCLHLFSLLICNFTNFVLFLLLHSFLKNCIFVTHLVTLTHVNVILFELKLQLRHFVLSDSSIIIKLSIFGGLLLL